MNKPEVIAVVGGQWGDEGKGKIVDTLASDADVAIRAQGGDNAGHTVVNERGKFALHLIPAGIFNPDTLNIIGAGVALNPETLIREMNELRKQGVSVDNLLISPKAHLAFDYHRFIDRSQEIRRGANKIDTTKRGIGPTYMDKSERIGLPARLLLEPDRCLAMLKVVLDAKKKHYGIGQEPEFEVSYYEALIKQSSKLFKDIIRPTEGVITDHLNRGSRFVLEGAHGALLDLDHGTYPMVTSSNSTVGGLLVGAGIPPMKLSRVVGVFKAYETRVGAGGMPTELLNEQGDAIREKGHEFGTTTGRPRRVGYFDGVASRYVNQINGFTDIAITRLDTLADMGELKICTAYKSGDEQIDEFPVDDLKLSACKPVYTQTNPGWSQDISEVQNFDDLPANVQDYCRAITATMPGARLGFVGVGPARKDLITLS